MANSASKTDSGRRAARLFRAAAASAEKERGTNLLARLFRGELSLTVTFWIFLVSVPATGELLFTFQLYPLAVESPQRTAIFIMWGVLAVFYAGVACTGLWRAAGRSPRKGPAAAARAAAVLGMAAAVAYAARLAALWLYLAEM